MKFPLKKVTCLCVRLVQIVILLLRETSQHTDLSSHSDHAAQVLGVTAIFICVHRALQGTNAMESPLDSTGCVKARGSAFDVTPFVGFPGPLPSMATCIQLQPQSSNS